MPLIRFQYEALILYSQPEYEGQPFTGAVRFYSSLSVGNELHRLPVICCLVHQHNFDASAANAFQLLG